MAEKQPTEDSPYVSPIVLIVVGAMLGGIAVLILNTENDAAPPEAVGFLLLGLGGLLAQIGAIAVGVLMGTERLRRGSSRDST